jgi:hypothetical protein
MSGSDRNLTTASTASTLAPTSRRPTRGPSAARFPRGPLLVPFAVAALVTAALLLDGPAAPHARELPPDPPAPLRPAEPARVDALRATGVTIDAGWEPSGVFGDVDPWSLADLDRGVADWAEALPQLRFGEDAATGTWFVEDAVVLREPSPCYHVARIVRSVGVALPAPAGEAIADVLASWLEPRYFTPVPTPVGPGPCSTTDRSQWGFAIEQAQPLPCALPERDVVCFTVAKWRSDAGARDSWTSAHLTFDAVSGALLQDADLHPQLDVGALRALVTDALCAYGAACADVRWRSGQIVPQLEQLSIELSPGEAAGSEHGSLRVVVPRALLPVTG